MCKRYTRGGDLVVAEPLECRVHFSTDASRVQIVCIRNIQRDFLELSIAR